MMLTIDFTITQIMGIRKDAIFTTIFVTIRQVYQNTFVTQIQCQQFQIVQQTF